jgi:hypothetical protein
VWPGREIIGEAVGLMVMEKKIEVTPMTTEKRSEIAKSPPQNYYQKRMVID